MEQVEPLKDDSLETAKSMLKIDDVKEDEEIKTITKKLPDEIKEKLGELIRFSKLLRKRVRNDFDAVLAIEGEEGVGKSTLSILLGFLVDLLFRISKERVLTAPTIEELYESVLDDNKYSYYSIDEVIRLLYKLNWSSEAQRKINTLFTLCREKNKIFGLLIPRLLDLNEYFRNHRVMFRIFIAFRGHAVVYKRDTTIDVEDPWHTKDNRKKMAKLTGNRPYYVIGKEAYLAALRRLDGYLIDFEFPDLPEQMKQEYINLKLENKYVGFEAVSTRSDFDVVVGNSVIYLTNQGKTQQEISELLGLTLRRVTYLVRKLKNKALLKNDLRMKAK